MFVYDNGTKIITQNILDNCKQYENTTICRSIEKNDSINETDCILGIIHNKTENCQTRNMTHENHLVKLSKNHIFWYITDPITLHISCEEGDTSYNMTKSTHIYLNDSCDEFHVTSEKPETIRKTIEIKGNELSANFSKYDEIYGNWTLNKTLKFEKINITKLKLKIDGETNDEQISMYRYFYDMILEPINYITQPITDILIIIVLPITLWICFLRLCCGPCLK